MNDIAIPPEFLCPITHAILINPVVAADGITYEKQWIEAWFKQSNCSPMTHKEVEHKYLNPNLALKNQVRDFVKENQQKFEQGLFDAVEKEDVATIESLLKLGIKTDIQNQKGHSLFWHTVLKGKIGILKLLIQYQIKIPDDFNLFSSELSEANPAYFTYAKSYLQSNFNSELQAKSQPVQNSIAEINNKLAAINFQINQLENQKQNIAAYYTQIKPLTTCDYNDKDYRDKTYYRIMFSYYVDPEKPYRRIYFDGLFDGSFWAQLSSVASGQGLTTSAHSYCSRYHGELANYCKDMLNAFVLLEKAFNMPRPAKNVTPEHFISLHQKLIEAKPEQEIAKLQQESAELQQKLVPLQSQLKEINAVPFQPALKTSLLHLAVGLGHTSLVTYLLAEGHSVSQKDEAGLTPLHCAIMAQRADIVDVLLKAKAPLQETDKQGKTPINLALSMFHQPVIKSLLKAGADPKAYLLAPKDIREPFLEILNEIRDEKIETLEKENAALSKRLEHIELFLSQQQPLFASTLLQSRQGLFSPIANQQPEQPEPLSPIMIEKPTASQ